MSDMGKFGWGWFSLILAAQEPDHISTVRPENMYDLLKGGAKKSNAK
jgi:hypothetical protein